MSVHKYGTPVSKAWTLPEDDFHTRLWMLHGKEKEERLQFPWRRLIARTVDFLLYMLVSWTVTYLVFHWNLMLLYWFQAAGLIVIAGLVIMFFLEPVLLSVFCTTPGKALLGLRVKKRQGGRISLKQGYTRMGHIFTRGCGYVIIPIYNIVRMYESCKGCQVKGVTEWDEKEDIECTFRGKFPIQVALSVIWIAIVAVLIVAVYYAADMPRQRGDLTVAQFEDNLESYWRFHGTEWNTALQVGIALLFEDAIIGNIFDRMDPPEVIFEETNGVVTGVSFQLINAPRIVTIAALPQWLQGYAVTFVGAQDDMNFIRMHSRDGVIRQLLAPLEVINNREGEGTAHFTEAGIEVYFSVSVRERVNAYFRMRKV